MPGGAPKGSRNRHNAALVERAIRRALARKHGSVSEGLIKLMQKQVDKADDGEPNAVSTILDRLAGKAHQTLDATVDHTIVDLRDSATLEDKLSKAITGRLEQPTEPKKPTLQ